MAPFIRLKRKSVRLITINLTLFCYERYGRLRWKLAKRFVAISSVFVAIAERFMAITPNLMAIHGHFLAINDTSVMS